MQWVARPIDRDRLTAYQRSNERILSRGCYRGCRRSSKLQQDRAPRSTALDNRPTHRSLRYRRGPATSGAASLTGPVRRVSKRSKRWRTPGVWGAV